MGKQIVYEGPRDKTDVSTGFIVTDEASGESFRLKKGIPREVGNEKGQIPKSLADELLEGEGRIKGHKFADAEDSKAKPEPGPNPGGPAGSGPSTDPAGTAAGSR